MGQNKIYWHCFKVPLVGTLNLCLEMTDLMEKVWAQLDHPVLRKRPKCAKILKIVKTANFQWFWGFHWSDWAQTFFLESGILRHKFKVPTRGTLEHLKMSIFFTLTPPEGTLGKIFLTRKLYFWYSIVIEHEIKHLTKTFSTKREEWHTLIWDYSSHVVKV